MSSSQRLSVPSVGTTVVRLPSGQRVVGGLVEGKPMLQLLDAEFRSLRTLLLDIDGGNVTGHVSSLLYDPAGFLLVHAYHQGGSAIEMTIMKVTADLGRVVWSRRLAGTNQNVLFAAIQVDEQGDYLMSGSQTERISGSSGCDALLLTLDAETGRTKSTLFANSGSCEDWQFLRQINGRLYSVGRWDPENQSTPGYRIALTKFTPARDGVEWVKYYVAPSDKPARCYPYDIIGHNGGITIVGMGDVGGTSLMDVEAIIIQTDLEGNAQRIDYLDFPASASRETISQIANTPQGLRIAGVYLDRGTAFNWVAQLDGDSKIRWASSVSLNRTGNSQNDFALALGKRFDFLDDRTHIFGATLDQGQIYAAYETLDAQGRSNSPCSLVEPIAIQQRTELRPTTYASKFALLRTGNELPARTTTVRLLEVVNVASCSETRVTSRSATYCQGTEISLGNTDLQKPDVAFQAADSTASRQVCIACPNSTMRAARSGVYLFGKADDPCLAPDTLRVTVTAPDTAYATVVTCEPSVRLADGRIVSQSGRYVSIRGNTGTCDSTIIADIVLGSATSVPFRTSFCDGDTLKLFGNSYADGGDFERVIQNGACAKTINITLTKFPSYALTDRQEVCAPAGFELDGRRWLPGETYTRTLATVRGCDSTQTTTFAQGREPSTAASFTICEGETHAFAGEGLTSSGTYERRFQRLNQCDSIAVHELTVKPLARSAELSQACKGDQITLGSLTFVRDTVLRVTALGANGCDSVHTQTVHFRARPEARVDTLLPACDGAATGRIVLSMADTLTFQWLDGTAGTTRADVAAGTYPALIRDAEGCTSAVDYLVEARASIRVTTELRSPTCVGMADGYLRLTPGDSIAYSSAGGGRSSSHRYDSLRAGRYAVRYVDVRGCAAAFDTLVPEGRALPQLSHASPLVVVLGDSLRMDPTYEAGHTLVWSPATPTSMSCADCAAPWVSPLRDTELGLVATDDVGCASQLVVRLIVDVGPPIYTPNAFSPNGDDNNERWLPRGAANVDRILRLAIFDRWGELVYLQRDITLADPRLGWDGTHRGKAQDAAVFVYVVEYVLKNGALSVTHGDLTLMR